MERLTDHRPRRRRTRVMGVSVALLIIAGVVAGCSTTPRAVLWIPFTYTAQMGQPTLDNPSGSTTVVLVACLDISLLVSSSSYLSP